MTTPAIRGLRHKYPHTHITVETRYPELFECNPYVNEAVLSGEGQHFDLYITMRYEDRYPFREHITDIFCRCAGVPSQGADLDLFFYVNEHSAIQKAIHFFRSPIVTLQPWPGKWTRNKDWEADRWERVVEVVNKEYNAVFIQLGDLKEPLIRGALDWRGKTTLREAALAIQYADLHIACNSFSEQVAHAVGTPAVILYGTTHPVISSYPDQIALYGGRTSTPCYHREKCEHRGSMNEIQVEDVLGAIRRVLKKVFPAQKNTESLQPDAVVLPGTDLSSR